MDKLKIALVGIAVIFIAAGMFQLLSRQSSSSQPLANSGGTAVTAPGAAPIYGWDTDPSGSGVKNAPQQAGGQTPSRTDQKTQQASESIFFFTGAGEVVSGVVGFFLAFFMWGVIALGAFLAIILIKETRQISKLSATKLGFTGTLRYRKEWWIARFKFGIGTDEVEKKWGFDKKPEQNPPPSAPQAVSPASMSGYSATCADCGKNVDNLRRPPRSDRPFYCNGCRDKRLYGPGPAPVSTP